MRRSALLGALAALLAAGLVQDARADDFTMTGQYRHGCCNFPNLMLGTLPFNDLPFALGGGGLSIRTGQPRATTVVDQALPGGTLMVPAGAIDMAGTFVNPTPVFPPSFLFLSTQVAFNNAAGTLAPGGGPGNAAYCMNNTTGPNANPNCTAPAQGGAPFAGNLLSHAVPGGAPNFGGTMALLGGLPVVNFARTLGTPVVVASGNNPAIVSVVGNPFASYSVRPQTIMIMSPRRHDHAHHDHPGSRASLGHGHRVRRGDRPDRHLPDPELLLHGQRRSQRVGHRERHPGVGPRRFLEHGLRLHQRRAHDGQPARAGPHPRPWRRAWACWSSARRCAAGGSARSPAGRADPGSRRPDPALPAQRGAPQSRTRSPGSSSPAPTAGSGARWRRSWRAPGAPSRSGHATRSRSSRCGGRSRPLATSRSTYRSWISRSETRSTPR